ncbi:CHAT domain-containing protein [Thelonectria olida]|uniref:CHAT domain-containing protein n=1 Tax=Thelonectria olida TaxID=1576542 RepID=A0A9P8VS25_9HYPO|nr:CHAT domain-containing protein [Thelonectria olida]
METSQWPMAIAQYIDRAAWLNNLGVRLGDRYSRTGAMADLEEAIRVAREAVKATPEDHPDRAGRLNNLGGRLSDRYSRTRAIADLEGAKQCFNVALNHRESPINIRITAGLPAIELLETGRGVLASSLQDLRTDLSTLQKQYPELSRSFVELRDQLDAPTSQGTLMPLLLKEIHSQSGFERFLLSASEAEMREAAVQGPIVILNVSSHRCDALIVEKSAIRVLELPCLSRQDIHDRARDVQSLETLGWLWDAVVSPVLDALGFNKPPSGDSWPHVWWIPTGPLVRFPLHAAGHHLERSSNTSLDRVVSSYSPSIKTIIHSRQQCGQETAAELSKNVVLIAMQDTPEQKRLQYTRKETSAVQAVCESMELLYVQPQPYNKEVLSALETCRVFHFAGHGDANEENPLQSLLLLKDWKQDPLTVGCLLGTNLSSKSPFLAYLSACGTGQIRHERSIDESIHLTGAFQLAGFRHVVGTL